MPNITIAKKILLSLIFTHSLVFAIFAFIGANLDVIKPSWFEGDKGIQIIFAWISAGVFLLAAISSLCWITNVGKGFWLWKLPALIVLPFSIPFLILDYLESKKPQAIQPQEKTIKMNKNFMVWFFTAVNIFNFLILVFIFVVTSFAMFKAKDTTDSFETLITIFSIDLIVGIIHLISSVFLVINFYFPKKTFSVLSCFSIFGWFYLFLTRLEEQDLCYFFKHKDNSLAPDSIE